MVISPSPSSITYEPSTAEHIAMARHDFRHFVEWVKGWRTRPHLVPWIAAFQKLADGTLVDSLGRPCHKLMILSYPRSAKSSMTRYFIEWLIGREYMRGIDPTVGYVCYADALATKNSRDVRSTIEATQQPKTKLEERYGLVFPGVKPGDSWSGNEWEIVKHSSNSADPTFKAAGKAGSVLGYRFDSCIVLDDLIDHEAAQSATEKQRVWDKYNDEIATRGEEAPRILISTRFAADDPAGRIMEAEDDWVVIHTPALIETMTDEGPIYHTSWPPEVTAEDGKHRGVSVETLLRLRERDPRSFATQYQAVPPASLTGGMFSDLVTDATAPAADDARYVAFAWDTAFLADQRADYSATVEGLMGKDGVLYITNAYQKHLTFGRLEEEAADQRTRLEAKYPGMRLRGWVEGKASGQSLAQKVPWLRDEPIGNKKLTERANIASQYVHGKRVVVCKDWFPMRQQFLNQVTSYDGDPHTKDDFVSALTLLIETNIGKRGGSLESIIPRVIVQGFGYKGAYS